MFGFGQHQDVRRRYGASSESRLSVVDVSEIDMHDIDRYNPLPPTPEKHLHVFDDVAVGEAVHHVLGGATVEVHGSVHGTVLAEGGGATVIVHGDVHPGARVGASGGGARVEIWGRVR